MGKQESSEQVLLNILKILDDNYEEIAAPMVSSYIKHHLGMPLDINEECYLIDALHELSDRKKEMAEIP